MPTYQDGEYTVTTDDSGRELSRIIHRPPPVEQVQRRIPKYDVRRALTQAEKIALAGRTKLDGTALSTQQRAIVDAIQEDYAAAPDPINPFDADFEFGINTLSSIGVFGPDALQRIQA